MTLEELDAWSEDFEAFHARFAHLFSRSEPREQSAKYMRALMARIQRRNGWQIAEEIGDKAPDRTQRLLYRSHWGSDDAHDVLQQFAIETFGDEQGIGVVDETGFMKQGDDSAGVKRQYSGTAGKVDNCQIGVFLSYATPKGNVFLDRRLYLPEGHFLSIGEHNALKEWLKEPHLLKFIVSSVPIAHAKSGSDQWGGAKPERQAS